MGTPNEGINGTLATGLIGHWDFTDGRLTDVSGNGRDLTMVGTVASVADKDGNENNAIDFDGASKLVTPFADNILEPSISVWFKTDGTYSTKTCVSIRGIGKYFQGFGIFMYGHTISLMTNVGAADVIVNDPYINPHDGNWHNAIAVYNKVEGCFKLYFDKKLIAKKANTANIVYTNTKYIGIGANPSEIYPYYSNDIIDEVRIYDRVLTDGGITTLGEVATGEIAELYEMGVNYTPITKCDTPTFSKPSGSYPQEPFSVTISTTTADADIYYTTDGSEPDETKTLYSEPVIISKTTTLKAIAIKEGFDNSDIAIVQYDLSDTTFVKTKHNIRVLETDLTLVAEIDTYTSFTFQRKLYNAGRFTLILNYYTTNALELTMNRLIMLDNNPYKVGIIKGVKYIQEGNNETLEVTGFELKGIFKQRVTIPNAGQSHQKFSTTNFETILKGLVQKQCIDNTTMKFNRLEVVANTNKGFEFGFETRYKKLDEEIEKISRNAEIGYQVYLDFETKKWKFDIIRSNVVLDENAFLPIFSAEYDNMERQEFESDTSESKNYAIVAGQGEGSDRTIKIVANETNTDIDLDVMFVDARDINDDADLQERGLLKLAESAPTNSFDCDIIDGVPFVYEIDWDLGDMVQIVSKKMGVKITKLVEEVTEFYQVGTDRKINAVFGKATQGIRKYIDTTNDVGID